VNFSYRACGLSCTSDTPIPGFWLDSLDFTPADLSCWINSKEPGWVSEARSLPSRVCYPDSLVEHASTSDCKLTSFGSDLFFELAYSDGARFFIDSAGARLSAAGSPPLSLDDLATYLRGSIMGFVLRRRGVAPLHACAVSVGGRSVVLCGPSESGKSTTAAALALRGLPVLCDDITALSEIGGKFYVEPGYPRICLWPDVAESLLGAPDALPRLTPTWGKCFLPLDGTRAKFQETRQPLTVVYLLAPRVSEARAPWIEDLGSREALLALVQNTYMNWLLDRDGRASEFDVLARLVTNIRVRKIVPHADPHRINALCELISSDAEAISADDEGTKTATHNC
jgi:hypothetical protein